MKSMKFKGLRKDGSGWIVGDVCNNFNDGMSIMPIPYFAARIEEGEDDLGRPIFEENTLSIGGWIDVIPESVGMYSRFNDKNGTEIFHGDKVRVTRDDGVEIIATCMFGSAIREINGNEVEIIGFYFQVDGGKKTFPIVNNYVGKHDTQLFEVIGNIHDK